MPIVINGTGTVTGLSAGGLPNGTVTADTLSSSALYLAAPAGAVCFVAQNTAPNGWLKANGAAVSRTTYADLFAALGTTFGSGDGSTTFNLPDMRGEFPRCWDDGRGIDSGRAFASTQAGANLSHSHGVSDPGHAHSVYDPGHAHGYTASNDSNNNFNGTGSQPANKGVYAAATGGAGTGIGIYGAGTGISVNAAGGTEARPRNIALLAIIKY